MTYHTYVSRLTDSEDGPMQVVVTMEEFDRSPAVELVRVIVNTKTDSKISKCVEMAVAALGDCNFS